MTNKPYASSTHMLLFKLLIPIQHTHMLVFNLLIPIQYNHLTKTTCVHSKHTSLDSGDEMSKIFFIKQNRAGYMIVTIAAVPLVQSASFID